MSCRPGYSCPTSHKNKEMGCMMGMTYKKTQVQSSARGKFGGCPNYIGHCAHAYIYFKRTRNKSDNYFCCQSPAQAGKEFGHLFFFIAVSLVSYNKQLPFFPSSFPPCTARIYMYLLQRQWHIIDLDWVCG